jgi:hypothetical protein
MVLMFKGVWLLDSIRVKDTLLHPVFWTLPASFRFTNTSLYQQARVSVVTVGTSQMHMYQVFCGF